MRRPWHQQFSRAPRAKRTDADGTVFDSRAELARWKVLQIMERGRVISGLERQVKLPLVLPNGVPVLIRSEGYPNGRRASYRADFSYLDRNGVRIYEELKGRDDPTSRLRRAVAEACHGITITVVSA